MKKANYSGGVLRKHSCHGTQRFIGLFAALSAAFYSLFFLLGCLAFSFSRRTQIARTILLRLNAHHTFGFLVVVESSCLSRFHFGLCFAQDAQNLLAWLNWNSVCTTFKLGDRKCKQSSKFLFDASVSHSKLLLPSHSKIHRPLQANFAHRFSSHMVHFDSTLDRRLSLVGLIIGLVSFVMSRAQTLFVRRHQMATMRNECHDTHTTLELISRNDFLQFASAPESP